MQENVYAEKVFYNGTIITMNDKQKNVEAVAVAEDRIIKCGTFKDVQKTAHESTLYIDLEGKTMLPGFIDAHSHIFDTAYRALWVDVRSKPLGSVENIEDIITLLQQKAASTPEGEWVVGWGYDDSKLVENRHPNKFDLDKVSTKHPVAISHLSGWTSAANSYALEKCQIDNNYQDTSLCMLDRDEDGDILGVFRAALCPIMSSIPQPSRQDFEQGLKITTEEYLAKGCTTAQEGWWGSFEPSEITQSLLEQNAIKMRYVLYPVAEGDAYEQSKDLFPQNPAGEYLDGKGMMCMGAMKLTMDGSNQAYTGYQSTPYYVQPEGKEGHCGSPNHSQEWVNERVLELHKKGQQVAIHCNGDAAIDMCIIAMEYAQKEYYREDPRFIFIHCQTARPDQLKRIAELKATISFFVTHTYFWGERHYHRFLGPEKALRLNPVQEALDLGINVTLHNDTYVTPIDPLLSVWSAVNRQSYEGTDMGKEKQGCSVEDALKAITINAAIQGFEENNKGSIEENKWADFVILENNPLTIESLKIKDIKVLATYIGGECVYSKVK